MIEISTLKSYMHYLFDKMSADIRADVDFFLDSFTKAKIFQNCSAGNVFLFFNRF